MTDETPRVAWGRGHVRHGRIPDWVLYAGISDRAMRLYVLLGRSADNEGRSDYSKAYLMKRLRCARSTLDAALNELTAIGALTIQPRQRDDGSPAPNDYILNWGPPVSARVTSPDGSEEGSSDSPGGHSFSSNEDKETPEVGADAPTPAKQTRRQNLPFNVLVEVCPDLDPKIDGTMIAEALKRIRIRLGAELGNKALSESDRARVQACLAADTDPLGNEPLADEIRRRARLYVERWQVDLTPRALAKHWTKMLTPSPGRRGKLDPSDYARMFDD